MLCRVNVEGDQGLIVYFVFFFKLLRTRTRLRKFDYTFTLYINIEGSQCSKTADRGKLRVRLLWHWHSFTLKASLNVFLFSIADIGAGLDRCSNLHNSNAELWQRFEAPRSREATAATGRELCSHLLNLTFLWRDVTCCRPRTHGTRPPPGGWGGQLLAHFVHAAVFNCVEYVRVVERVPRVIYFIIQRLDVI